MLKIASKEPVVAAALSMGLVGPGDDLERGGNLPQLLVAEPTRVVLANAAQVRDRGAAKHSFTT